MTNVAICISGFPRNIKNSYEWLEEFLFSVLRNNNIHYDVFCSFWETDKCFVPDSLIFDLYNPIKLEIEDWNDNKIAELGWKNFKKMSLGTKPNFIGMFYKIFKCNELSKSYERETGIKYDVVIRARTELKFINKLEILELKTITENPSKKQLFLKLVANPNKDWTRDTLALGNRSVMDIYSNLWNHLLDLNCSMRCSTPEILLRKWLEMNGVVYYNTSLDHIIQRG